MAVRGNYSVAEAQMLAQWTLETRGKTGWLGDAPVPGEITYPVAHRLATRDLIINMANGIYDPNPLFRDADYARKTRWGTIIAPPFFEHCISHMGPIVRCKVPAEVGDMIPLNFGTSWVFFKAIHEGDSFRVWCNYTWEDMTDSDGKSPRKLLIKEVLQFFNQKNELVCNKNGTRLMVIMPKAGLDGPPPPRSIKPRMEEYRYTDEELAFVDNISDAEKIRGSEIRWWEDTNVGDELPPVVKGPVTPWDCLMEITGLGVNAMDTRQMRKITPQGTGLDRETGVWHNNLELHLVPKTAPWSADPLDHIGYSGSTDPINHIGMTMEDHALARLITNWMGDDGFLKSANFKVIVHPAIGDTFISRGRVIRKYITEEGEHAVDITCWLEGIRGFIHVNGTATVGLLSRESVMKDLLRY